MALREAVRPAVLPSRPLSPALDGLGRGAALLVPLAVTALRVASSPEWRDDAAVVTGLGFVPFGAEGAPSALLAQLLSLVPVGGRVLREGLVGALACCLASASLYRIARGALLSAGGTPRLTPLLALTAALTATLSPAFQHEGMTSGGAALAVAVALFDIASREASQSDRPVLGDALVSGAVFGLVAAERRLAAGLLAAYLVSSLLIRGIVPTRKAVLTWTTGVASSMAFWLIPLFLRPMAKSAWMDLGPSLSAQSTLLAPSSTANALGAWASDMGPLPLALGLVGLAYGLFAKSTRAIVGSLTIWIAATVLLPHERVGALAVDPLAPMELLATASLAVAAVLGVQTIVAALHRFRVPFAEPAGVLLVVFHFTLVFVAAEQTSMLVTDTTGLAADVWTDEALAELPPNSLLLVRSRAVAFRIWAVRVTRGERPDLVMVPLGLLDRGSVARRLLEQEPALGPLVRDVAMTGRSTEYSLSLLADARPVFVELDPSWDRSLLTHIRPTPLWLRFVPHTLGRSDRASALTDAEGRRALSRVIGVARSVPGSDAATLAILEDREREKAVLLASLGDKQSAEDVLASLLRLAPSDSRIAVLGQRLREKKTPRPEDMRELLE